MSLINKMLQDLDARGGAPGEAIPPHIKPVAHASKGRRPPNKRVIAAAVAGALAGLAVIWFGVWPHFSKDVDIKPTPPVVARAAPELAKPGQGMTSTIRPLTESAEPEAAPAAAAAAPASAVAPAPESVAATKVEPADEPAAEPASKPRVAAAPAHAARREPAVRAHRDVAQAPAARPAAPVPAVQSAAQSVAPLEPDSAEARAIRRALALELEARAARKAAAPRDVRVAAGRQENTGQRAEGEYRRALASLQEGRMIETIAALEQTLRIDPGHEAARQTLVGLLIEARRPDDAMRQLQLALTQDARQPALAMLLARLQIERGGSGIDTLMRTLPYAGADPDYHAFLAGALQRQQRHREAAGEYLAALRAVPGNGVWWMGLGISLQAEKRNAEALAAFQKAQASSALSPELQAFVARQVLQLGR